VDRVRWLGPGFVVAATAIGASHLVLAPTAGALFGYGLLWVIPFAHVIKYPAFEFGPRYAIATGAPLLDGYARMPGPRGWALWLFLAGTVIQGVTVLAGVLGVAAAVAASAIPAIPIPVWSLILGLVIAGLLRFFCPSPWGRLPYGTRDAGHPDRVRRATGGCPRLDAHRHRRCGLAFHVGARAA
jgi:Mn2+/Fe2+ NRAMP family transporter